MRFAQSVDGDSPLMLVWEGSKGDVFLVVSDSLVDLIRDHIDMWELIENLG